MGLELSNSLEASIYVWLCIQYFVFHLSQCGFTHFLRITFKVCLMNKWILGIVIFLYIRVCFIFSWRMIENPCDGLQTQHLILTRRWLCQPVVVRCELLANDGCLFECQEVEAIRNHQVWSVNPRKFSILSSLPCSCGCCYCSNCRWSGVTEFFG